MKKLADQIKEKLDKGITTIASTISSEPPELIRIKGLIKELTKRKEEALFEFGKMAYECFEVNRDDNNPLSQKYDEIKKLDNELRLLELEAEKVRYMVRQPYSKLPPSARCECGAGLEEGQRFCGNCGKNIERIVLEAVQKRKAEELINCSRCAAKIPRRARFCPKCGIPQRKEEPTISEKKLEE